MFTARIPGRGRQLRVLVTGDSCRRDMVCFFDCQVLTLGSDFLYTRELYAPRNLSSVTDSGRFKAPPPAVRTGGGRTTSDSSRDVGKENNGDYRLYELLTYFRKRLIKYLYGRHVTYGLYLVRRTSGRRT